MAAVTLPAGAMVLNLRRERFELARTVRTIASQSGKAIELRVLQYGVTRDRFVRTSDGWRISRRAIEVGISVEMVAPDA